MTVRVHLAPGASQVEADNGVGQVIAPCCSTCRPTTSSWLGQMRPT